MLRVIFLTLIFSATQTIAQSTINGISTELELKREDAGSLKPKLRPDDLNTVSRTEDTKIDELSSKMMDAVSAEKSTNSSLQTIQRYIESDSECQRKVVDLV